MEALTELLEHNHVKYGLIMSSLTALCLLYMYITGTSFEDQSTVKLVYELAAPVIVWSIGLLARRRQLKGVMSYREGLNEGFRIGLVYAIVSPFVFLGYYTIYPKALQYVRDAYNMVGSEDMLVTIVDMAAQFVGALLLGTILGAVLSFFLKSGPAKKSKKS